MVTAWLEHCQKDDAWLLILDCSGFLHARDRRDSMVQMLCRVLRTMLYKVYGPAWIRWFPAFIR